MSDLEMKADFVIIGGGAIGLFLAMCLKEKYSDCTITVVEKEDSVGKHTSGRNSGVLHAGIYYKPNTLKAKICQRGSIRLKKWIQDRELPINNCGKLIIAQNEDLDAQIDILKTRAENNGVYTQIVDAKQISEIEPNARSASGRGLWSPNTSVTDPKRVINEIEEILISKKVCFKYRSQVVKLAPNKKVVYLLSGEKIEYGHLFNCAGLYALDLAHKVGIGHEFELIPFKGNYWRVKDIDTYDVKTNIYPVPNLDMPFLGIHFTPDAYNKVLSIGPTATLALGRENYNGLKGIEPSRLINNVAMLGKQYLMNENNIRKYVHQQSLQGFKLLLVKEAQKLIPSIRKEDIIISKKVGIRPQLYSKIEKKLVDDFTCRYETNETHILNGISPAFTASFELADLIISESRI